MTTKEVLQKVTSLMSRGPGILQPSAITMKDGRTINGIPYGLQMNAGTIFIQVIDNAESAPLFLNATDVDAIVGP